jgi:hypothetical protein
MKQSDHVDEAKKTYEAPALLRWGTVQEITRSVGNRGASDGGHKRNKRTDY